jgi:hypothetical protein
MSDLPEKPKKRGPKPGLPQRGGVPKGFVFPRALEKAEGKARLRELVLQNLEPIARGLIGKAVGINHMMLRDPETGQWVRLTEVEQIEAALNAQGAEEGRTYWIHTKDPDVQAATTLLDRTIGKPVEEMDVQARVAHSFKWITD